MSRPNILIVLCDQLRFDVFGHRGNRVVATPNIDRLAAQGVTFSQATCSSPLCGPSRAALLTGTLGSTGNYTSRNCEPDSRGPWLKELTTADQALADHGYQVHYHGKWHTGREYRECYRGRDDIFGHDLTEYREALRTEGLLPRHGPGMKTDRYTGVPYTPWPIDDLMESASTHGYSMPHDNEAGIVDVPDDATLTAWTVKKTIRFLEGMPQTPFAATCSILQPHAPLIAARRYADLFDAARMPVPTNAFSYEDKPSIPGHIPADQNGVGQFVALYYALVSEVDHWIGRLLDTLDRTGLASNTLLVFTADHGELMGEHRTFSKCMFFEGCLRVPLLMRLPDVIPEGIVADTPASGVDLAPTILDFAGVPPLDQFQGRTLRPAAGGEPAERAYAVAELDEDRCVRSRHWKYFTVGSDEYLFDLQADPGETINLASAGESAPAALSRLREIASSR